MTAVALPAELYHEHLNIGTIHSGKAVPTIYTDTFDRLIGFYHDAPKYLVKTLKAVAEWSAIFFPSLLSYTTFARTLSAFKCATIFNWEEFTTSLGACKTAVVNYLYQKPAFEKFEKTPPTGVKVIESLADVISKGCEVFRWAVESKIFVVGSVLAGRIMLLNGVSMIFCFGKKIIDTRNNLLNCYFDERSAHLWKLAQSVALFAIGVVLFAGFLTGGVSHMGILICTTATLISAYGMFMDANKIVVSTAEKKTSAPHSRMIIGDHCNGQRLPIEKGHSDYYLRVKVPGK